MTKTKGLLLAVAAVAMAFTFSCSSDAEDNQYESGLENSSSSSVDNPSSSSVNNPSSSSVNNKKDTYYMEVGGVSVYAYEWFNSNPGASAYDVLRILNQYPVVPDLYRDAQRGVSREDLEAELDIDVPGYSKEQFLRLLDRTGAAIQFFIMQDGDYIYFFVEKEF